MYDSPQALGFLTVYIRLLDYCDNKCPYCGSSDVIELHPDSGHSFLTMKGWVNMIDFWYLCLTPGCPGNDKFKAPQPLVLPYKKFGRDVWCFICNEIERYRSDVPEIKLRLKDVGIIISEDTIRGIIDEYKLLKEGKVDEATLKIIQKQQKMIIGVDGTPTETGQPSLWTFYDVLSGRLLYAAYLAHADAPRLCEIFHLIAARYGVRIAGFLSDHQPSVVNAAHLFDPLLPHQTCHYHYLRNHWDFIEMKDTHLNQQLREAVNRLALNRPDPNGGTQYSKGIAVDKAEFFAPLMRRLKQIVNTRTKEFDQLKGMHAYQSLQIIVNEMVLLLKTCPPEDRPVLQLKNALTDLITVLEQNLPLYQEICALNAHFQQIRQILEDAGLSKSEKIGQLQVFYATLWDIASHVEHFQTLADVSSKQPNFNQTTSFIYCQWCRLWQSHLPNLFVYYDVEGMEKTNIYNEQLFSQLKQYAGEVYGPAHKSYIVLTRGDRIVKEICAKDPLSIHDVLTRYDLKGMKVLKAGLKKRIQEQTKLFRNSPESLDAVHIVIKKIQDRSWEKNEKGGL